jgi:hypothetical protein
MLRDFKGRFARQSRAKKVLLVLAIAFWSIPLIGQFTGDFQWIADVVAPEVRAVNSFAGVAEAAEVTPSTLEAMKGDVLDRLGQCENPKQKPIVFDTNGIASVGQYQWQPHSFQYYWQKMTGEKLSEKNAVIYALDDAKARELASWVIFETEKGSGADWVNCTAWHDLDTLVEFIKAHE